jgi:hypothetical protein
MSGSALKRRTRMRRMIRARSRIESKQDRERARMEELG